MTQTIKSVHEVMAEIRKAHGDHAIIQGSQLKDHKLRRISTGVLSYDAVIGGGWPTNQFHMIVGEFSAAKSVLAQQTIIAGQKDDPNHRTLYVAAEPMDYEWLVKQGMNLDQVEVAPTRSMEQAYDIIEKYARNRLCDLVVIDSLPALVATEEDAKDFMDALTIGKNAQINNKFFNRKGANAIQRSLTEEDRDVTVLVINQYREKIGVMMGDNRTTPGGKGKDFAWFVAVEMKRLDWLKYKNKPVGARFRLTSIKNKSAPVRRAMEASFYFDDVPGLFKAGHFDHAEDIFSTALYYDLLGDGGGGVYRLGDRKWKGGANVLQSIREEPDLQQEIRDLVLQVATPGADRPEPVEEDETDSPETVKPKRKVLVSK